MKKEVRRSAINFWLSALVAMEAQKKLKICLKEIFSFFLFHFNKFLFFFLFSEYFLLNLPCKLLLLAVSYILISSLVAFSLLLGSLNKLLNLAGKLFFIESGWRKCFWSNLLMTQNIYGIYLFVIEDLKSNNSWSCFLSDHENMLGIKSWCKDRSYFWWTLSAVMIPHVLSSTKRACKML